jgi:hypothetical protein
MIATIRATDHEDFPALSKFLVRAYRFEPSDFHFDPRLLKWKYLYPRAGWQGSRSYLFERSGEIVAHGGICPVSFRLPTGRIVSGHVIVDWAADSRMPGLGVDDVPQVDANGFHFFCHRGRAGYAQDSPTHWVSSCRGRFDLRRLVASMAGISDTPQYRRSLLRLLHARALSRIAPPP